MRARLGRYSDHDEYSVLRPLKDVLADIGRWNGVKVEIDEAALKAAEVDPALRWGKIMARKGITFDRYLRCVLRELPATSPVVHQVVGDTVRVTSLDALKAKRLKPEPPPETAETKKRYAAAQVKLKTAVKYAGMEADPKVGLIEVFWELTKEHGLVFDFHDAAFQALGSMGAWTPVVEMPLPAMNAPISRVIETALARLKLEGDRPIWMLQNDGVILITTARVRDGFVTPAGG